jgi:hypothetical protein
VGVSASVGECMGQPMRGEARRVHEGGRGGELFLIGPFLFPTRLLPPFHPLAVPQPYLYKRSESFQLWQRREASASCIRAARRVRERDDEKRQNTLSFL